VCYYLNSCKLDSSDLEENFEVSPGAVYRKLTVNLKQGDSFVLEKIVSIHNTLHRKPEDREVDEAILYDLK